ncbi:L,D-transpeptidase family protein [Clostridium cibarium]|uniref:L,D-transpeptidase/peptidoglycan binding protein n=1 Tax=Clostridium cibarium TaxID=2762247 RepID=A0ABR8PTQ3_9CLOT|nr:peptidoglycan binding domain-containing protein [Clostridium cibarium]MBD7911555.1 L,D-transpeptidase/peptidoglycan binding protein [Clostridium cibarium]
MRRQRSERSKFVSNKFIKGIIISFSTLLVLYLGISIYFTSHFYFGTALNGINITGKTAEEADKLLASRIESYSLQLEERGDTQEQINASDLGLKYTSDGKVQELKDNQNAFLWIFAPFINNNNEISGIISYDDAMLNKKIDQLDCVKGKNIVEPKNASLKYTESGYEIVDEVYGNKINKTALHDALVDAIQNNKTELNLDSSNVYENPKYTANSKEVLDAKDLADKYVSSKIDYTFGDNKSVELNGSTIHNWLEVNGNFELIFNESKVKNYVYSLGDKYNTTGITRDFKNSSGATIKVSGGDYGWHIDGSAETQDLIETIKNGQTVTKEPKYSQKAASHSSNDIGNTYVEVDLAKQHLWFYKNGSLVVEGNVVTGNAASADTITPPGVYLLKYKEKDTHLKGTDYNTPVSYWMPFNNNIGIHDAWWRPPTDFVATTYLGNGSHGCVNAPVELAKTIFENIEAGTPVVCY